MSRGGSTPADVVLNVSQCVSGICAGIEMRAYSIAARALRRLVVDAAAQLQSSALVPAPAAPLADFFEADGRVTTDLHILLKHVQLASSLYDAAAALSRIW